MTTMPRRQGYERFKKNKDSVKYLFALGKTSFDHLGIILVVWHQKDYYIKCAKRTSFFCTLCPETTTKKIAFVCTQVTSQMLKSAFARPGLPDGIFF
jgi:hypothetical protein